MIRRSNGVTNERSEVANEFSSIVSPSTPPGNDLNIAKESCSTWLDYVGPLITDELDSEKRWSYRDPKGNIQGIMDPNTSIGRLCLGEDNRISLNDGVESNGEWDTPEYHDTSDSGKKKEANAFTFYRMETEDISERYDAPCFVNGLEAYDGEINLEHDKNLISNEFMVKLCLEHEMKNGDKVVKKELIVALRGEIYFVKFIINPEEDDIGPGVVLGRSFLRLTKGIVDFGNRIITIYPDPEFSNYDDSDKANKSKDDWDVILKGIDFEDIQEIDRLELPPYVCNIGKSSKNKKKPSKNYKMKYDDKGHYLTVNRVLTRKELSREELEKDLWERIVILNEPRPIIETLKYGERYKKVLDTILLDKLKLDGELELEEVVANEEMIREYKAIKEKDDHEHVKPVSHNVSMLNHSESEPMGMLKDILCQVGVITVIARFLILDMPVDCIVAIIIERSFLHTCGGIINTLKGTTSTFDGVCHQKFYVAKIQNNGEESDSDDEEEYYLKRDEMGRPLYGPNIISYFDRNDPMELGTHDDEASSSRPKRTRQSKTVEEVMLPRVYHEFLLWGTINRATKTRYNTNLAWLLPKQIYPPYVVDWGLLNNMGCTEEIEKMLEIKVYEIGGQHEIFTSEVWRRLFDINEKIYTELCHEFYSTYTFDEVCADDELRTDDMK
ncbi:hypothetical protein Tco_1491598 [Tanacetum coccineum]